MLTVAIAALTAAAAVAGSGARPADRRLGTLRPAGRGRRLRMPLAAATGGLVAALDPSPILLTVLIVAAAAAGRLVGSARAASERTARRLGVVEVTFALAGELRAGRTPVEALAAVAPTAGPLRDTVVAAAGAARSGRDAAAELAGARGLPGAEAMRYLAAAWSVADSAGGRIAAVLERLSAAMDADEELRRELDAAMAGPRATMALLAGLPVFGLVLGQAVGAHPLRLLLHRPLGWALLGGAAVLDLVGVLVTSAIARFALRA